MSWNPNAKAILGLEYRPTTKGKIAVGQEPAAPVAFKIPSTASESVTSLVVPHEWSQGGGGFGRLWADIYDLATDPFNNTVTQAVYLPAFTYSSLQIQHKDGVTTTNLHTSIDDPDTTVDPDADYLVHAQAAGFGSAQIGFNTAALPATARPLAVWFDVRAMRPAVYGATSFGLSLDWYYGNLTSRAHLGDIVPPSNGQWANYTLGPFYVDPNDEGPWNRQSILDMGLGNSTKDNLRLGLWYGVYVTRIAMRVVYVTEKRVAVARTPVITTATAGPQFETPMTCAAPATSLDAAWAKESGKTYAVVMHAVNTPWAVNGALAWQPSVYFVDAGAAPPHPFGELYNGAEFYPGEYGALLKTLGSLSTRVTPYALSVAGNNVADSQAYYDVDARPVSSSYFVSQGIGNGDAASTYRGVRAVLGVIARPTTPLLIGVRKTSTTDASEAWTGANGSAWPAQWTQGAGSTAATATIQGNAGQMTTGTAAAGYYRRYLNVALATDFLATVKVTFAAVAAVNSARIFFRGGTTFTNGVLNSSYEARLSANNDLLSITRYAANGAATLLATAPFTVAAGTQYTVKIVALPGGFGVKVWPTIDAEPDALNLAVADATNDGTHMALGVLGGADGTSDTITFEDLAVINYAIVGTFEPDDLDDPSLVTPLGSLATAYGTVALYDTRVWMDVPGAVLANVDYTLDAFSAVGTWYLAWLQGSTFGLGVNQTFGGLTDAAAPGGGVKNDTADFLITVGTVPSPPGSLVAAVATQALPDAGDVSCAVPSMEYTELTWTATALGADFDAYVIQRSEDDGVTWWANVASVYDEAVTTWSDYGAPRNTSTMWRIGVRRADGATSDWRTSNAVVNAMSGQVILFTSNEDPSLNVGFIDLDPDKTYQFPGADDLVLIRRYGVDNQSAFRPIERRGVMWTTRVLIYSRGNSAEAQGSPPGGEGARAFDALRNLAETQTAITVLTPDGERFFAALKVPTGQRKAEAHYYAAPVTIIESGTAPTEVIV